MITQVPLSVNDQHAVEKLHIKGALYSVLCNHTLSLPPLPFSILHPSPRPVDFTAVSNNLSFLTPHFSAIDRHVIFIYLLCVVKCVRWNVRCFVFFSAVF